MLRRINRVVAALTPTAWREEKSRRRPSSRSIFWRLRAAFGLVGVALLLAACNPAQHHRTVTYGIGTNLYYPGMAAETANLAAYLGYLCEQAGLGVYASASGAHCNDVAMGPREWTLLVATGWNDVDGRCDAYLAWLDNQRRQRLFVNAQMSHIRTLTSGIFAAVQTGVDTVNIVGVALGFVQDTYNSYNNRILVDIEGSTVETIVIERRLKFREELSGVLIQYKPDAVRMLRDYLRICTPYAIRMSVNTYSRATVTGTVPLEAFEAQRLHDSLLSTQPLTGESRTDVIRDRGRKDAGGFEVTNPDVAIDVTTAIAIQRALCFPDSNIDGTYGARTEAGLKLFLAVDSRHFEDLNWRSGTIDLSEPAKNTLRNAGTGPCPAGAQNWLERTLYGVERNQGFRDLIAANLKKKFSEFNGGTLADMRPFLDQWRKELGISDGPDGMFAAQLTPDFLSLSKLLRG